MWQVVARLKISTIALLYKMTEISFSTLHFSADISSSVYAHACNKHLVSF